MLKSTVFRSNSQNDLLKELRVFINGTLQKTKSTPLELTQTGLLLLRNLPAARAAVLEYLCTVFDLAALNYITRLETEISTGKLPTANEYDEVNVTEVHNVLCNFVSNNAEAWAPIISTWSLELLGEISSKYAGRAHVSAGLNETLQLWMSCLATRTLIDITTQCLSCLMHSDTEACINALLDTSVKHSPNFDWVVAHVGSCFPNTVIVRVLSCGLKDFCQNKSYQQGCDSPKLKSVVGILGHLATSHADNIQRALLDIFNRSLIEITFQEGEPIRIQKKATVPFLLQLLSLSSTLLNTIDNIKNIIPINIILQLYNLTDDWCKYFGSPDAFKDLLQNLIIKCEKGGAQIINLLLDCIYLKNNQCTDANIIKIISNNAQELLECILQEIDFFVRRQNNHHKTIKTMKLLNSLVYDVEDIYEICVSKEEKRSQIASRLIIYIGQNNPPILIKSLIFIFQNAKTEQQLALFSRILSNELIDKTMVRYSDKGGHFSVVFEQILNKYQSLNGFCTQNLSDMNQMWINLLILLRWEKSGKVFMLKSKFISIALEMNLIDLTVIFSGNSLNPAAAHTLSEILNLLEIPAPNGSIPLKVVLNFVHGIINYFFICCAEEDEITRINGFQRARNIFKRLCIHSKVARNLALKLLLEKSLFSQDAELFGATLNYLHSNQEVPKQLIIQNKKMSKTIHLTKHSSVYNGGIIGTGKRKSITSHIPPIDFVSANTGQLINVIKACCTHPADPDNVKPSDILDSLTLVSLMLVQLISPDVMYNGLPWPEEEFSKVTIERDLLIRRKFNTTPLLWDLLNLVAIYRPAISYCSVLLRALTATLMHQWTSMGDQSKSAETPDYKSLMTATVRVIDLMSLGQLLPPPLSNIRDVVQFLNSYEIVAILRECIWCYMRDHIPSPALFGVDTNGLHWRDPTIARPPDLYTKTLKIIMQRNIKTVGHLYSQMFITIPQND